MPTIQFWFEFGSTYSYLAAMRIEPLLASDGIRLEWRPFLLGPLFQRQGWNDSPFNLYPARGRHMWRDVERHCLRYGLPFRRPSRFPRNGLLAARLALLGADEPWGPELVRSIYRANFGEDRDIADPDLLAGILGSLHLEAAPLMARAQSPENKERLRAQTEAAWEAGIFGAPSFLVDGELFWGNDRLDHAVAWANGDRGLRSAGSSR